MGVMSLISRFMGGGGNGGVTGSRSRFGGPQETIPRGLSPNTPPTNEFLVPQVSERVRALKFCSKENHRAFLN